MKIQVVCWKNGTATRKEFNHIITARMAVMILARRNDRCTVHINRQPESYPNNYVLVAKYSNKKLIYRREVSVW